MAKEREADRVDEDILKSLMREDPSFTPPVTLEDKSSTEPYTPKNPKSPGFQRGTVRIKGVPDEAYEGIDENTLLSRKTGALFKRKLYQEFAGQKALGTWHEAENHGGRPRTTPDFTGYEDPEDCTIWIDGEAWLDTRIDLLPQEHRNKDTDPPELNTILSLLEYHIHRVCGESHALALVLADITETIEPIRRNYVNHRWTAKRVRKDEVHRLIHNEGPLTTRQIAHSLWGPFTDIVKRYRAETKVHQHVRRLIGFVESIVQDDAPVKWRSVRTPEEFEAGHPALLGFTPRPEPTVKRLRLTITGEAFVFSKHDDRQAAITDLHRVTEAIGLHLRKVTNDPKDSDAPAGLKKPYKLHPNQRRADPTMAMDTINNIRQGYHGPQPFGPMLCYFPFFARMLYQPRSQQASGHRYDIFRNLPAPTIEEQRHMEGKAFRMLRKLERQGLVVRRKAPDGRVIIFVASDREADDYPPAWVSPPSITP